MLVDYSLTQYVVGHPLKYLYFILDVSVVVLVQAMRIQVPNVACTCFLVLPSVFGL